MAKKSKKTTGRSKPVAKRGSKRSSAMPRIRKSGPGPFAQYFLPGLISLAIVAALGFMVAIGYQTVTASDFFNVRTVDVTGSVRSSINDIRQIVVAHTERSGTWNADLPDIKAKVEKLPFVRTVAVTRVLPGGIRVIVTEREPVAVVRLSHGSFLIDADGEAIAPPATIDSALLTIIGWDETKTEKAVRDNQRRMKLFQKMVAEWGEFGLAKRVKEVELTDLLEPKALVEDSGQTIPITLAREDLSKSLKSALEAIAGKGQKIRSVNAAGVYPVIQYAGYN